jgi:hypothetical protein
VKQYRKTIPLTIASKKNQTPRSKLNKDVNDLYKENYKPLKKEIEDLQKMEKSIILMNRQN